MSYGYRDLDDDDASNAAMADRDEDPRASAGYSGPTVPTRPASLPFPPGRGLCAECDAGALTARHEDPYQRGVFLFPRPYREGVTAERVLCAGCAGKALRNVVEVTRDTIGEMRTAAAVKDHEGARRAEKQLVSLVGVQQARETASAIAGAVSASEKLAAGKRGRQ